MKKIKYLFALPIFILMIFALTACYDLGGFENEEAYKNSFDITFKLEDNNVSYDFSSFINKDVVEKLSCPISANSYSYIAIKAKHKVTIKAMAFYLQGDSANLTKLSFNIYKKKMPTKLRKLSDELAELKKAKEENRDPVFSHDNNEPSDKSLSYVSSSTILTNVKWASFYEDFKMELSAGDEILIQIVENTDVFEEMYTDINALEAKIEERKQQRVKFKITGILMAAE